MQKTNMFYYQALTVTYTQKKWAIQVPGDRADRE